MLKQFPFSSNQISELKQNVTQSKTVDERLRLTCIYLFATNHDITDIAEYLIVSEKTVYAYLKQYRDNSKTKNDPRSGRPSILTEEQSLELEQHLKTKIYQTTSEIQNHIEKKFSIKYKRNSINTWLIAHGFAYKKPKLVPATVSVEKQENFIQLHADLKQHLKPNEEIIFIDGVHPDHQTQAIHGWIKKGTDAKVPSTGKQKRVHYMGGVSIKDDKVIHRFKQYKKIDSDAIIDFLIFLKQQFKNKRLYVFCDNASYHKSKQTNEFLEKRKRWIKMEYLLPRSPQLNPIERMWKLLRENVTYNKYYSKFENFSNAVHEFLFKKLHEIEDKVRARITDKFYVVEPKFLAEFV